MSHSSSDAVTRVRYQHMRQTWLKKCYKAAEVGTVAQAREWGGDFVEGLVCPSYFCRFLGLSQSTALSSSTPPLFPSPPHPIPTSCAPSPRPPLAPSTIRH